MSQEFVTASAKGYLQADHKRLDGLMQRCLELVAASDMTAAMETFADFRRGLLRHINIEEWLLFPALESSPDLQPHQGPTAQMRHEHQEIVRLLVVIQDTFAVRRFDPGTFDRLSSQLTELLRHHNEREERVAYTMTDSLVPAEQLKLLIQQLRSY